MVKAPCIRVEKRLERGMRDRARNNRTELYILKGEERLGGRGVAGKRVEMGYQHQSTKRIHLQQGT
jgi:hypothetical protein